MVADPRRAVETTDPGEFTVRVEQRDGQCIYYRCAGELDLATAPILREALEPVDSDATLNFVAVSFLDSSGIAVLAAQAQRLTAQGHTLRLHGLQDLPRRALQITGLLDQLT